MLDTLVWLCYTCENWFTTMWIVQLQWTMFVIATLQHIYVECCVTSVVSYLQDLPKLKSLDLSYNEIAIVCDLHTKIGNLSKLILAFNQIATLKGNWLHVDIQWHMYVCIYVCMCIIPFWTIYCFVVVVCLVQYIILCCMYAGLRKMLSLEALNLMGNCISNVCVH